MKTESTKSRAGVAAAAPCSRRMIYPGLHDRRLKRSWEGDVVDIADKKTVVVATVNARTLKEMRALKHHLVGVIRDFYANTKGHRTG